MATGEHLNAGDHCFSNDDMATGEAVNVLDAGLAALGSDQNAL